jgi:hypothetical protein
VADDRSDRGQRDRTRINVHEDYEVQYWSQKWGVTREQLTGAVKHAGPMVEAVAQQLHKEP